MPLFRRRVDPAEREKVLGLLRAIFQGNAKIDSAKGVALAVMVCNDVHGGDLLEQGKAQWRQRQVLGQ